MILRNGNVTVPLTGLVDILQEKIRLEAELKDVLANTDRLSGRLENEEFDSKAPQDVIDKERERLDAMIDRGDRLTQTLSRLG